MVDQCDKPVNLGNIMNKNHGNCLEVHVIDLV